jgi:hypothetical protein
VAKLIVELVPASVRPSPDIKIFAIDPWSLIGRVFEIAVKPVPNVLLLPLTAEAFES